MNIESKVQAAIKYFWETRARPEARSIQEIRRASLLTPGS